MSVGDGPRVPMLVWPNDLQLSPEACVPRAWHLLCPRLPQGSILVLGASDSGKSTFARYLFRQLSVGQLCPGYLDGDMGQSTLGLPTTLNLALRPDRADRWETATYFVGHISPRGHMLPLVIGTHTLLRQAHAWGVTSLVVDTTGLVDPAAGGVALAQALIELLDPAALVGLRRDAELDPILRPWRTHPGLQVFELSAVPQAVPKPRQVRIQRRHERWLRYFVLGQPLSLSPRILSRIPVFGLEQMAPGRLVAFQDSAGLAMALGVVRSGNRRAREWVIHTPLARMDGVCSLRVGALRFDMAGGQLREWAHRDDLGCV